MVFQLWGFSDNRNSVLQPACDGIPSKDFSLLYTHILRDAWYMHVNIMQAMRRRQRRKHRKEMKRVILKDVGQLPKEVFRRASKARIQGIVYDR